jgi:chemotaxis protein CheD
MKCSEWTYSDTIYLHPGELCVCDEPTQVITVLGSCVSVTLFNPRLCLGAICHATLPECRTAGNCESVCIEAFRYMDCAVRYMLGALRKRGVLNKEIEIKMFGGADTLISQGSNTVGSKNVQAALSILQEEHLNVVAMDVGDSFGRKLIFYSNTGEVFLKRLRNVNIVGKACGKKRLKFLP